MCTQRFEGLDVVKYGVMQEYKDKEILVSCKVSRSKCN